MTAQAGNSNTQGEPSGGAFHGAVQLDLMIMQHGRPIEFTPTIEGLTTESSARGMHDHHDELRPILHHLNADSSWLLQLPHRSASPLQLQANSTARSYYNILIDPWLQGSQTDMYASFSRQWHAEPSSVQNLEQVCALAWQSEMRHTAHRRPNANCIDLVVVSHEFTDHCHKETLLEVATTAPVLASKKAAKLIRSWEHFKNVTELTPYPGSTLAASDVPSWLHVSRLQNAKDALYLHAAVVISFETRDADGPETIIYTPHGITLDTAAALSTADAPVRPLCLIHGLHDVWLTMSQQINLGGHNGLRLYRQLGCKYWVSTHDEDKKGEGVISYMLRRNPISINDALAAEAGNVGQLAEETSIGFQIIPNGGKLVLA